MIYAVVIPVYNERTLFPLLIERLLRTPVPAHPDGATSLDRLVVIVDDGSADGTRDFLKSLDSRPGILVALHDRNQGKGAAVRTGFARALQAGADIVLVQDADLEYDPRDHAPVLMPILEGRADAVFGSRFLGQAHRVLYFWHSIANRFITFASDVFTNLNLTDVECCFKALTRDVAAQIVIQEDRFGVEPELAAKVARARLTEPASGAPRRARVYEVAVSYAGRTYEEGKKITWRDGVAALWCILKYGLRP